MKQVPSLRQLIGSDDDDLLVVATAVLSKNQDFSIGQQ